MIFLESTSFDPFYNLALEEHIFSTLKEGEQCLILWQNSNTIVVGKNQNTAEEINKQYTEEHNIKVVRRLSGGGAVYHDKGNLNFTIILGKEDFEKFNFKMFIEPVIKTLKEFEIVAEFTGRNDITIDEKKFCGNAQYSVGKKLLHHGCIMLDSNLTTVTSALNVKKEKYESKGVKSVISRVTTINSNAKAPISMETFKEALKRNIISDEIVEYKLTDEDNKIIDNLIKTKYSTFEWNYGTFGNYNKKSEKKYPWGLLTVLVQAEKSYIQDIRILGDFFGDDDLNNLQNQLKGLPLNEELMAKLTSLNIDNYIHGCTAENLYEAIMY